MTLRSIIIKVDGEPQPQPKDTRNKYGGMRHRDKDGRKYAWSQLVRVMATTTVSRGLGDEVMFPKGTAVRLGVEVRVRKPKRNKKRFPTQVPDWSNYRYFIENILEGVVYYNDCQVIGPLPGDKRWCLEGEEPGVTITVTEVNDVG